MARTLILLAALCVALPAIETGDLYASPKEGAEGEALPRYPQAFREEVAYALERGVASLRSRQAATGHWGDPAGKEAMGHTALPLLALLKSGVAADDEAVKRAFHALQTMPLNATYSVACYLMAMHARYQPALDSMDGDVGTDRSKRLEPAEVRARISDDDSKRIADGLAYLLKAQNRNGLWHYTPPASTTSRSYDLSNTQYAMLGLRAAADAGFKVPHAAWRAALRGVLALQMDDGPKVEFVERVVRDGYVFQVPTRAKSRGWRYTNGRSNGPQGKNTVYSKPMTGSMTTAGVACVVIAQEGLWRSRRFSGRDRKSAACAIRDGLAWLTNHWSVTKNPGQGGNQHMYYLYGLERMGMLTGKRFLGEHDWYAEGARAWLDAQAEPAGGWGSYVNTAFGILFLKRSTMRSAVITGE